MAEDISDDFDEIEKALVTVQTYIRRYHALTKYCQLRTHNFRTLSLSLSFCLTLFLTFLNRTEHLHQLSKTKGFSEAVIKIQAAIRTYNSWETLQRISRLFSFVEIFFHETVLILDISA
jgi:hypothetical protein